MEAVKRKKTMSGLELAARYSLRPHELGFCGPKEATKQKLLRGFLRGKISAGKIRATLKKFIGAYHYYRLIARSNKIKDPLDEKIIRAYWVGNTLLEKVKIDDLRVLIAKDFTQPGLLSKEIAKKIAASIPGDAKPHHSFHVFFIGSVTGTVNFKNTKLKDLCRIGWGRIKKIKKDKVLVEYQPLTGEKTIKLSRPIKKEIIWDKETTPKIKMGDWVSFHWGWLVEVLTKSQVANLKKYTVNTLKFLR